jgi:hypothetical protein
VIDRDELERLLHDVAHGRAGGPVAPPDDALLDDLRAQGRTRRRRRARRLVTLAAALLVAGVLAASQLVGDRDPGRVKVVDEPSTTTTTSSTTSTSTSTTTTSSSTTTSTTSPPSSEGSGNGTTLPPASGMPASTYVGLDVTAESADGTGLATGDGQPLGYLTVGGSQPATGGRSVVQLVDADSSMVWLLSAGWPTGATILDAVDAPWEGAGALGTGCTTDQGVQVVALVGGRTTDPPEVTAAWTVAADGRRLDPVPPTTPVTCTG